MKDKTAWMATEARKHLPNDSYAAKMYDFVKSNYDANITWEQTRDALNNWIMVLTNIWKNTQ